MAVDRTEVFNAQVRIAGSVERTPLVESDVDEQKVWLKCECLQTGGAFKLRGASNRLLQLSDEERLVRDTARAYAQGKLQPRVTEAFLDEHFDRGIMSEISEWAAGEQPASPTPTPIR